MIKDLILLLIKTLSLTIIIELIVAIILGIKDKKDILNIILINCVTNPIINYLMLVVYYFIKNNIIIYMFIFVFESLVVICEYYYFKKYLIYNRNKLLLSFILNISSFLFGLIMI